MSVRAAIRWELRLARRSRPIWLVVGLLCASLVLALWSGRSYRARWHGEIDPQLQQAADDRRQQATQLAAGDAEAAFPLFVDVLIALPPPPLVELAAGRSDLDPRAANATPRGHATTLFRDYQTASPFALIAARFDLAFVLVFLVPILIIALGYNLLAEERERGIERLLLVHGVSRWGQAVGRIAVRGGLLALPVALAMVAVWGSSSGTGGGVRTALALLAVIGYMALWWGLTLLVGATRLREGSALLVLLALWIVLALLLPAAIGAVARTAHPPPSRFELIAASRAAEAGATARSAELIGGYLHDHPELERAPRASPSLWFHARGKEWFVVAREVEESLRPIVARFDAALAEQRAAARTLRMASPPLVLHGVLTHLAGTDEARAMAFRAQARAFQQRLREEAGYRTMAEASLSANDLDALHRFEFVEPPVQDTARGVLGPVLLLWGAALLLAMLARRRLTTS